MFVVSNLRLLPIFLLQKYMSLGAHILHCVGSIPVSGVVVSWVFRCSALVDSAKQFTQVVVKFCSPSVVYERGVQFLHVAKAG